MNTFTFSIGSTLREAWALFKKHLKFFLTVSTISIALGITGNSTHIPWLLSCVIGIASMVWAIVWMKVSLAAARNDEGKLLIGSIQDMLPSVREFLTIIGIAILGGLLTLCGFILLILPGIYVAVRLSFSNFSYLDRKEGVRASLRFSWNMTKGHFWKIFWVMLIAVGLYILGFIALGIGILIAYPLASILVAKLYVILLAQYQTAAPQAIVEQPVEIPAEL